MPSSQGLMIFYPQKNDWDIFTEYPDKFNSSFHSLKLNSAKNELYLLGHEGNLLKIELNTMKLTECTEIQRPNMYPCIICMNNQLHVIAGDHQSVTYHHAYINGTNIFEKIHEFPRNFSHKQIFYSSTTQMLYLFGHNKRAFGTTRCCVWRCNLGSGDQYKWEENSTDLDMYAYAGFDATLVHNDQYAIFVAEWDKIYVMNMKTLNIKEVAIKAPKMSHFGIGSCFGSDERYDVLALSLMRECTNGYIVGILRIIKEYARIEYIHLIERGTGSHWRIPLNKILQ